jgi:hypothetical protein
MPAKLRAWRLLTAVATLLACGGDRPTEPERQLVGTASLTIEMSNETRTATGLEAAYYVYNPGPTPSQRAMYLLIGTRESGPGAVSVELFQFLPDNQEHPSPGTFGAQYGALGGDPAMGASVLVWVQTGMRQLYPVGAENSVTLEEVTPTRVTGRLRMNLRYGESSSLTPVMVVHGTFVADRVGRFEDLPRIEF